MASPSNDVSNMQMCTEDEHVETSPLAFTVQFDDPKPEGRKLKIHDKLSSFALKHRRNPSLPDFKAVKTAKSLDSTEPKPSPSSSRKFGKHLSAPKAGYHSEGYFSSDQDEESIKLRNRSSNMPRTKVSPVTEDKGFLPHMNGVKTTESAKTKKVTSFRRSSMNDIDLKQMMKPKLNSTFTMDDEDPEQIGDGEKSDTVSEAGTYTVEKDESPKDGGPHPALNETIVLDDDDDAHMSSRKTLTPENHKWINDWVKKVAEESLSNPPKEPPLPLSESGSSSASASKIPSPVNTMPKIREPVIPRRSERLAQTKVNGVVHRRSSSLSAKDFSENRKSDSSLETESYLMATESVVVAMQSRMRQNLKLNLPVDNGKKGSLRKERLHPPSTASDTDTNSDNDARAFKKPQGAPFTSARLNRAFSSLRRGRTEVEPVYVDTKKRSTNTPSPKAAMAVEKRPLPTKTSPAGTQAVKTKITPTTPFARTDCGRFSMRSTVSLPKTVITPTPGPKKEVKKPAAGGRSNSSLSSREMEFQNWKRRKSFDPMKAAAEGRKKEAAKKAAVSQSMSSSMISPSTSQVMTQSVNLGTTVQPRNGNAVLRSASFHTSPHMAGGSAHDMDGDADDLSPEEPEEEPEGSPPSSCFSHQPALPPNSPNRQMAAHRASLAARAGAGGSRGSLNSALSEVHSSPSRRARAEFIDSLLVSAIAELSIGLKIKSCELLKKLDGYCDGEERISRMRDELAGSESQRGSASSSPSPRQTTTRDFPAILKNLKTLDNVLQLVDDVLFGEAGLDD